mgnify:CR=1 FL=1
MSTTWFFAPDIATTLQLPEEEAKHAIKVLRHKAGDTLQVADGKGMLYTVTLLLAHPKKAAVRIEERECVQPPRDFHLHLAVAPTKNSSRMEWLLEKATEIGVEEISFLQCEHSERQRVKLDRWQRIVVSAMKQSRKTRLPILHDLQPLRQWMQQDFAGQRFIAHLSESAQPLGRVLVPKGRVTLLVGPEGDFSEEEVRGAQQNGFQSVTLSPYRLRTETAALVAVEQCNFMHQMKE